MAGVLEEVLTYLAAQGLGTAGTDLFKARMPDKPDACGVVYETGGAAPDVGFGSTTARFENPAIQVVFRGAALDYEGPRAQAKLAWEKLVAVEAPTALSGTSYNRIVPLQQPFPLGEPDEKNRHRIACNYLVEKDPTA